jgi:hypothetical protein
LLIAQTAIENDLALLHQDSESVLDNRWSVFLQKRWIMDSDPYGCM